MNSARASGVATDELGTIVSVKAVHCTLPESLLPRRLRLCSTYVGLHRVQSWYVQTAHDCRHRVGMISLPVIEGDGTQNLRQLIHFLERNGYSEEPGSLGDPAYYVRS